MEDMFQGEVGYEVQTFAEILPSIQATQPIAPHEPPIQRVVSIGSIITNAGDMASPSSFTAGADEHTPATANQPSRLVASVNVD